MVFASLFLSHLSAMLALSVVSNASNTTPKAPVPRQCFTSKRPVSAVAGCNSTWNPVFIMRARGAQRPLGTQKGRSPRRAVLLLEREQIEVSEPGAHAPLEV